MATDAEGNEIPEENRDTDLNWERNPIKFRDVAIYSGIASLIVAAGFGVNYVVKKISTPVYTPPTERPAAVVPPVENVFQKCNYDVNEGDMIRGFTVIDQNNKTVTTNGTVQLFLYSEKPGAIDSIYLSYPTQNGNIGIKMMNVDDWQQDPCAKSYDGVRIDYNDRDGIPEGAYGSFDFSGKTIHHREGPLLPAGASVQVSPTAASSSLDSRVKRPTTAEEIFGTQGFEGQVHLYLNDKDKGTASAWFEDYVNLCADFIDSKMDGKDGCIATGDTVSPPLNGTFDWNKANESEIKIEYNVLGYDANDMLVVKLTGQLP